MTETATEQYAEADLLVCEHVGRDCSTQPCRELRGQRWRSRGQRDAVPRDAVRIDSLLQQLGGAQQPIGGVWQRGRR